MLEEGWEYGTGGTVSGLHSRVGHPFDSDDNVTLFHAHASEVFD